MSPRRPYGILESIRKAYRTAFRKNRWNVIPALTLIRRARFRIKIDGTISQRQTRYTGGDREVGRNPTRRFIPHDGPIRAAGLARDPILHPLGHRLDTDRVGVTA